MYPTNYYVYHNQQENFHRTYMIFRPCDLIISEVNTGSGNDFVSSGKKQLPQLVLTTTYDAVWHRQASMN